MLLHIFVVFAIWHLTHHGCRVDHTSTIARVDRALVLALGSRGVFSSCGHMLCERCCGGSDLSANKCIICKSDCEFISFSVSMFRPKNTARKNNET